MRTDTVTTFEAGTTIMFYTDGLIERRNQSLDTGIDRLRDTIAGLAGLPLTDFCERILSEMLPDHPDDDVAVLAVRLHEQS
jgi:serine phosphatase RsbU (regulator of sigma subunit)